MMYTNTTTSSPHTYALHPLNRQAHRQPTRKAPSKKQSVQVINDLESFEPIESWDLDDFSDMLPGAY